MEKITLQLTRSDYESLLTMMGYANGARAKSDGDIPRSWKEVTDWVIVQGAPADAYTYYHEKKEFQARKQAELSGQ